MKLFAAFLTGLLFGTGIMISGMANPAKVQNFFDVAGHWDPSLAFVMGGALITTAIGYRVILRKPAPRMGSRFHLPSLQAIDTRLIAGAAIFGIGWGIAGFCPGGALPALGTLDPSVLIFTAAMVAGMICARVLRQLPQFAPKPA